MVLFKVVRRIDTELDSASSLCEDRAQDLLDRFSEEAAVQDPCIRISVQGV